jgi:hypothetical protein
VGVHIAGQQSKQGLPELPKISPSLSKNIAPNPQKFLDLRFFGIPTKNFDEFLLAPSMHPDRIQIGP